MEGRIPFARRFRLALDMMRGKQVEGNDLATVFGMIGTGPDGERSFQQLYEGCGTLYAATNRIAWDLAGVPLRIRQRRQGSTVDLPDNHPARLFFSRANSQEGKTAFWARHYTSLFSHGNAYALLDRGLEGKATIPQRIWHLQAQRVTIITAGAVGFVPRGYRYDMQGARSLTLRPDEVYHAKLPNTGDDFYGLSPYVPSRILADLEMFTLNHWMQFYRDGARPGGALTTEQALKPAQVIEWETNFNRKQAGWRNAFKWLLVHSGFKVQELAGVSPKDADFVNQFEKVREQLLSISGVPPALAGVFQYANYANVDKQVEIYWDDKCIPTLRMTAEDLTDFVLPLFDPSGSLVAEYDLDAVPAIQARQIARAKAYGDVIATGAMTPDAARKRLNQPPVVGGDQVFLPSTLIPLGPEIAPRAVRGKSARVVAKWVDEPARNARRKAISLTLYRIERDAERTFRAMLLDSKRRVLSRLSEKQGHGGRSAVIEATRAVEIDELWDEEFEVESFGQVIGHVSTEVVMERGPKTAQSVGGKFMVDDPNVRRFIEENAGNQAQNISATTKAALHDLLVQANEQGWSLTELRDEIDALFEFGESRSMRIARTESVRAFNAADQLAFEQNRDLVAGKTWLTAHDDRVRDSHAEIDGEEVGIDEVFSNDCAFPGDPNGDPGETCNCRCTMEAAVSDANATEVQESTARVVIRGDLDALLGKNKPRVAIVGDLEAIGGRNGHA